MFEVCFSSILAVLFVIISRCNGWKVLIHLDRKDFCSQKIWIQSCLIGVLSLLVSNVERSVVVKRKAVSGS